MEMRERNEPVLNKNCGIKNRGLDILSKNLPAKLITFCLRKLSIT